MSTRLLLATIAALVFGSIAHADDWPQFRGPNRDGLSKEKGLLKEWPKGGLKPVWSFKNAGLGFSSMSIADGKLYTLGSRGDDEVVIALDSVKGPDKGAELWTVKLGPIFTPEDTNLRVWGDGPRSSPTVDGKRLYALGAQGELVCLDISSVQPKEVWRKNLIKDLGGEMMSAWGFSESPLVDGKRLICTPGGGKGTLAALDKMTGKVIWRSTEVTHKAPYTSVIVADIQGKRQYIQNGFASDTEGGFLSGFSAEDGKLLWSHQIVQRDIYNIAASPLVQGSLVYQTTYKDGCHLFDVSAGPKAKDLYSTASQKVLKNNHGGVVLIGDHVYGYSDRGWVCQEFKSGKRKWDEEEFVGQKSGSTIAADGMLYLYTDKGEIGLAEANPKEFNLVSSFTIPQRSKYPETRATSRSSGAWSYPAIANGYLYLRDAEFIYCYDIRDKK